MSDTPGVPNQPGGHSLRVGYVPGVTPDKWARSWRERPGRTRLRLVPQEASEAEAAVRSGDLDMALVRLPVEREGLHLVRLYDEVAVVVVARDHPVAAYDEIDLADLAGEQFIAGPPDGLAPTVDQLDFRAMTAQEAIARCEAIGLPFAPINRPEDLFGDPHLATPGAMVEITLPDGRRARAPALPLEMDGRRFGLRHDLPTAGQHGPVIAAELGYGPDEIKRLIAAGILGAGEGPARKPG